MISSLEFGSARTDSRVKARAERMVWPVGTIGRSLYKDSKRRWVCLLPLSDVLGRITVLGVFVGLDCNCGGLDPAVALRSTVLVNGVDRVYLMLTLPISRTDCSLRAIQVCIFFSYPR